MTSYEHHLNEKAKKQMSNFDSAVAALKTAKTVTQWNEIRSQHVPILNQLELFKIDAEGLIVETLGIDTYVHHTVRYEEY